MKPSEQLRHYGQSIWLDYISRDLIRTGALKHMIEEDGITGITKNPSLFEKAIDESDAYDEALECLLAGNPHIDAQNIYERLTIEDVRMAVERLRPVYDHTKGRDGFVSIEVSPYLAHDTEGSIMEARRLWSDVDSPNLMIKIPATQEGIPAIESLLAGGINVNITLMFSCKNIMTR
jgi:transaldolase